MRLQRDFEETVALQCLVTYQLAPLENRARDAFEDAVVQLLFERRTVTAPAPHPRHRRTPHPVPARHRRGAGDPNSGRGSHDVPTIRQTLNEGGCRSAVKWT